ncbi:helix-turn-helix transcriptional regulator [Alkalicella caledoniensis]|uniref:Helix-turn-helix transcriptional regulator n=1 Tax=Alkalicella caledoniensis TaxID=2731377 RepID=A0A7G9WBC1_ALKCA|nr:S24 family peptidase [Alkalicella caledoniensis]QNO15983.1 helix-turn-helix transcriptional regulator [Alkalicella caledoniensis]
MNSIGVKIKEARLEAKLTEKQLARKCGVAESFIIQVESGRKVINEKIAENILSKLGKKLEPIIQEDLSEDKAKPKQTKVHAKPQEQFNPVEPTGQWADALANVIKKFPIYEVDTNKVVGNKDLPVLDKKVEGYRWDKVMFVKITDDDLGELRIHKNDTVMVNITNDIQNNGIYLVELNNKRLIRRITKESSKVTMTRGLKDVEPISTQMDKIKLVGKCVKVEFQL